MKLFRYLFVALIAFNSCVGDDKPDFVYTKPITPDSTDVAPLLPQSGDSTVTIQTGALTPVALISYAETLKGIPYLYGSIDPKKGFDCSGFITYVFNHFKVAVPRQSIGFASVKRRINLKDAKSGDLILFTGTDSTKKVVGHMGILKVDQGKEITFLHSTSGKDDGVTETPLNTYYLGRYMHTIRIFPQNDK
ncbi:C40 family peptidase [Mucilaginibacter auburnensis]|uniref:Cell wall-associated NlpC family hydrolase n=1 Tax=Mucilaginibacter auburnensis TaxID=1457233 RepID=A0A2H9VUN2_9SPHI|nr:NlpC/P60 family protein [Mucilaginibacter auburnensis]PJJ84543.1 cell wall-associated NlpC family hydrolase [Mucilaginibacter auburnensis]